MLTVDASVWMSALSPGEPDYPASRALLGHIAAVRLTVVVPTLVLPEVAGAIRRTRGDATLAREYATSLLALPFLRWVSLDEGLAASALALAADRGLRGADAVYAAVALSHGCDLVSLDREHLTRLRPTLRTMTPADALASLIAPPPP